MDMVEPSSVSNITLIVKAASQAVDDKSVKCTTSWTILQLKHHLINIYPTVYPYALKTSDMKIIYAGKLLQDNTRLKDTLKSYTDNQTTHTVHMVCSRLSQPTTPTPIQTTPLFNENELRHRHVLPRPDEQPTTPHQPYYHHDPYQGHHDPYQGHHYYQHALHYAAPANTPVAASHSEYQRAHDQYLHQMTEYIQYYNENHRAYLNSEQNVASANASVPVVAGIAVAPVVQAPAAPAAPPVEDNDDEDGEDRDWLHYMYSLTRCVLLLSFIYFYSTIFRFLAVTFFFGFMHLYQRGFYGWFRRGNVDAAPLRDENVAVNQPADQVPADQPPAERENDAPTTPVNAAATPIVLPPPGIFTMLSNFCVSFFTSLVPQLPEAQA